MPNLGNNVVRLTVGNAFAKNPPAKATEGVLKSHILKDGNNSICRKADSLRDYYFRIAKLAEKKDSFPSADLLRAYFIRK